MLNHYQIQQKEKYNKIYEFKIYKFVVFLINILWVSNQIHQINFYKCHFLLKQMVKYFEDKYVIQIILKQNKVKHKIILILKIVNHKIKY